VNQVNTLSGTNQVQSLLLNPKTMLVAFLLGGLILFLSLNGTAFAREPQTNEKRPTLSQKQSIAHKPHKKSAVKTSNKKAAVKTSNKKSTVKTSNKKSTVKTSNKKPIVKKSDKKSAVKTSNKKSTVKTSNKKSADKKSDKKLTDKKSNKKLAYKRSIKKRTPQKKHGGHPQIFDKTLQAEIKKYLGVPYRYGGNTTKGMDCSGFVKRIYSETFSTDLPHQASQQFFSPKLEKISSKNLQTGDLVFFSAPKRKRINHVGIYLSNNKFIHAIRKKGITVSSLNSNCWQSQIVGAKRLKGIDLKDASTHVPTGKIDLTFVENEQIRRQFAQPSSAYIN